MKPYTTGVTGVNWDKKRKKWRAKIQSNGSVYQSHYTDLNHAIAARSLAEYRLHSDFSACLTRKIKA
jgi:hypothetical protein